MAECSSGVEELGALVAVADGDGLGVGLAPGFDLVGMVVEVDDGLGKVFTV